MGYDTVVLDFSGTIVDDIIKVYNTVNDILKDGTICNCCQQSWNRFCFNSA